jgi:hypothetical protein
MAEGVNHMELTTTKPLPHTDSTDPVEILRVVARAILAEPKRYDQGDWITVVQDWHGKDRRDRFPDCGTIACVAGWTVVVTLPPGEKRLPVDTEQEARVKLGLDSAQADKLFSGAALRKYLPDDMVPASFKDSGALDSADRADAWRGSLKGTAIYARAGVQHITDFVRETWGVDLGVL